MTDKTFTPVESAQINVTRLVRTLAQGFGEVQPGHAHTHDLSVLCEQAYELAAPVLDYETAAREAGWADPDPIMGWTKDAYETTCYDTCEELCDAEHIEPHEHEVIEFWAVSDQLAEELIERGERVDEDFADLNVWARCGNSL